MKTFFKRNKKRSIENVSATPEGEKNSNKVQRMTYNKMPFVFLPIHSWATVTNAAKNDKTFQ